MFFAFLSAFTLTAREGIHLLALTLHHLHSSNLVSILSSLDLFISLFELYLCQTSLVCFFESLQSSCVPGILSLQLLVLRFLDGDAVSTHLGNIHLNLLSFTSFIFNGFCPLFFESFNLFLSLLNTLIHLLFLLNEFVRKVFFDCNSILARICICRQTSLQCVNLQLEQLCIELLLCHSFGGLILLFQSKTSL